MSLWLCKNLSVVMYRKFRNVPIFEDFSPICPYFLGFSVGRVGHTITIAAVQFILKFTSMFLLCSDGSFARTLELTEDIHILQITGKRGCMILMFVNSVYSRSQTVGKFSVKLVSQDEGKSLFK